MIKCFIYLNLLSFFCFGQLVKSYKSFDDRIEMKLQEGTLCVYPLAENAARINFFVSQKSDLPELILTSTVKMPKFEVIENSEKIEVKLNKLKIFVDKKTSSISYADVNGNIFLSEKNGSRKLTPGETMGEPCYDAGQSFLSPDDEKIFGLGQFQDGNYNLKNVARRLTQVNSQIAIPFIYSSKGYGLLWNQYGLTDFNPADNKIELQKQVQVENKENKTAEVTTTAGTKTISQNQSLYQGKFSVPKDGEYSIFLNLGDMDNRQSVLIDGEPVIDLSNLWLPPTIGKLVNLKSGEHDIQVVCKSENVPELFWKLSDDLTTFRSPHTKMLDYTIFYGPSADEVISTYRNLSGNVPMLPRWAYGFWQCRERYTSGNHLTETVKEFRKRNLPMDVIVQDWQYWGNNGWGVPIFDSTNYADPEKFIKEIHDLNAHFNISIWSNPDKNSSIGKDFLSKNLFIPDTKWLDYFNPLTREAYWKTLKDNLFDYGVDSWWMDATEPENDALHKTMTYLGPGDFYRLTYPLFVSRSVYEGQREATDAKRVCILTRSAFSGQQRYGTINWSGDIGGNWDSFQKQIVAGLNFSVTGMPYWTTDIGGFFRPGKAQYTDKNFGELLIRWFQWGVFNPIFRIHGYQSETEPWKYSAEVENNMKEMLNLRYRLLPYVYSEAWQITKNGSTMMRPLVMDFREDAEALKHPYEYMFGKSFLVNPVTEFGLNEIDVYMPESSGWIDFWTGEKFNGSQVVKSSAPLNKIPLFVKAGSIIPMGPEIQYAAEKTDPVEIRIFPGADGEFTLYEDENDSYNYEKGMFSTIKFEWNEENKTLIINKRNGSFPGMLDKRVFNIVIVSKGIGAGMNAASRFDKTITYTGEKVVFKK
ncbi:MAG: DUF5110 domain-containing protein [Ignavibacteria bacterium]|nr:DUF5110 domain-containing protein [Ignavibacteria bacterium]